MIIGLPQSGKTTVFNALTQAEAATGGFGGGTDEPNLANVKVPDPRLDPARRDRIDADAERSEIGRHLAGERGERRLGGGIGGARERMHARARD